MSSTSTSRSQFRSHPSSDLSMAGSMPTAEASTTSQSLTAAISTAARSRSTNVLATCPVSWVGGGVIAVSLLQPTAMMRSR